MKNRSIIFSFLVLSIFSVNAMELAKISNAKKIQSVRTSFDNIPVNFFRDEKSFYVKNNQNSELTEIHSYNVDSLLKKMNDAQLEKFQQTAGYLVAKRLSNGEYKLKTHVNGVGGGIICGAIGYYGVKVLGYGVPAVAATATIGVAAAPVAAQLLATGGATAGLTAVTTTAVGGVAASTTATMIGVITTGGVIAAEAIASGVVAAVGTTAVAETTVVATTALGASGYIATVETVAAFVGALGSVPWLP